MAAQVVRVLSIFDFRWTVCQGYAAPVRKSAFIVALAAWIGTMAASRPGRAVDRADSVVAEQIAHLLDYVASDYGGAVSDGEVTNPSELLEQVEVLAEGERIAAKLPTIPGGPDVRARLTRIETLVREHRPETEVRAALKGLRTELDAFFDIVQAPQALPSRSRGRALYEEHCATCHGQDGRADTPRAAEIAPRPANFQAPEVARLLSPARVFATTRFGVPKTAMVPFDFLSEAERWDIAFYVSEFDHARGESPAPPEARVLGLAELANATDDELREDLVAAGIAPASVERALDELRTVAPYEEATQRPKGPAGMLILARASLKKVGSALVRGDREGARARLLNVYLDDIEPIEASMREADLSLTRDVELTFKDVRAEIERGAPEPEINKKLAALAALLGRAGPALERRGPRSFSSALVSSAGLALREGAEAALLIAALLAVVGRSGAPERKRWVHVGWISAAGAGVITWFAARRLIELSGVGREMLEGIAALLAAAVLFYVSYWLFAKRQAARWMTYLRSKAQAGQDGLSLFGISFLAVYREAFETILFYQPLVAQPGTKGATAVGALVGGALLALLVFAYDRAGRFAPPRSFFAFSTFLLYALSVVFAGQGIAALQTTGHLPFHSVALPRVPALGIYPTMETYAAQALLLALGIGAGAVALLQRAPPAPPGPADGKIAGSREGIKL